MLLPSAIKARASSRKVVEKHRLNELEDGAWRLFCKQNLLLRIIIFNQSGYIVSKGYRGGSMAQHVIELMKFLMLNIFISTSQNHVM
jgi:hypothetical protein